MSKIRIYIWAVKGEGQVRLFFSKKEAENYDQYVLGGWGEVKKVVKSAYLVRGGKRVK